MDATTNGTTEEKNGAVNSPAHDGTTVPSDAKNKGKEDYKNDDSGDKDDTHGPYPDNKVYLPD